MKQQTEFVTIGWHWIEMVILLAYGFIMISIAHAYYEHRLKEQALKIENLQMSLDSWMEKPCTYFGPKKFHKPLKTLKGRL